VLFVSSQGLLSLNSLSDLLHDRFLLEGKFGRDFDIQLHKKVQTHELSMLAARLRPRKASNTSSTS
jgi:hypothetical protein